MYMDPLSLIYDASSLIPIIVLILFIFATIYDLKNSKTEEEKNRHYKTIILELFTIAFIYYVTIHISTRGKQLSAVNMIFSNIFRK
jgi:glucose uptake protein GlcU